MIPEFKKLSLHDQTNLLKRSVVEMLVIRDIIMYDIDKGVFYAPGFPEKFPIVTVSTYLGVLEMDMKFFRLYVEMQNYNKSLLSKDMYLD